MKDAFVAVNKSAEYANRYKIARLDLKRKAWI